MTDATDGLVIGPPFIRLPQAEILDPLVMALKQLNLLYEWLKPPNDWMLDPARIATAVRGYHPDTKYDPVSRHMVTGVHLGGLWAEYEATHFDISRFQPWVKQAVRAGYGDWATFGPIEHRSAALTIAAQLAVHEGERLRQAINLQRGEQEQWRCLYWFTRFFRAWQRIGAGFTPAQMGTLTTRATAVRTWKRDAWEYYEIKSAETRKHSLSTIAANFVKLKRPRVSAYQVEIYLSQRKKLSEDGPAVKKQTVGRRSPNKRQ